MILLELTTESGAIYRANVIHQRIRRISPEGEQSEWVDYKELQGGNVGERLVIFYPEGEPTLTTRVVDIRHPEVGTDEKQAA